MGPHKSSSPKNLFGIIGFQCNNSEFGCFNGKCILIQERCDGSPDCSDKSDERFCEMVVIDKDVYRKESPPVPKNETRTNVTVEIVVTGIGTIDEIQMTVEFMFALRMTWYLFLMRT